MTSSTDEKARLEPLPAPESFVPRHLGPDDDQIRGMLAELGHASLEALADAVVPDAVRTRRALRLPAAASEAETLNELRNLAARNKVLRSYLGMGYSDCVTPPVLLRNLIEDPGWYTQYTPYQSEISQGRLEALLNFQTMIADLTGLAVANASLLDEATAAAEAMAMFLHMKGKPGRMKFFAAADNHPQVLEVVQTRAKPLGVEIVLGDPLDFALDETFFGALLAYPSTTGEVRDYRGFCAMAHEKGALVAAAADLLSLVLLTPPGEWGADVAVGNTQRFGVPLGYGGPHAAYFATTEAHQRRMPGRIVGVSKDADGRPALRLSIQTREQHIRREKATSNICTAQVLLAIVASMYACWHGPEGLTRIATRLRRLTLALREGLRRLGYRPGEDAVFDTVRVPLDGAAKKKILADALAAGVNLRALEDGVAIALDETVGEAEVSALLRVFAGGAEPPAPVADLAAAAEDKLPAVLRRTSPFLTHPVFRSHRSETKMLRYLTKLKSRDLSLTTSMIPLGSCTMKLNAAAEMIPVTWPEFARLHPFAPLDQAEGYRELFRQLEGWLAEVTGFSAVSLQPNAGSQGEYAGLLVIRRHLEAEGRGGRDVCLIPQSAHGTNPASAVMAGLRVVVVACDEDGNIDLGDLRAKADEHKSTLAALMVTYPSTHGVFEEGVVEACKIVHERGGQVYMDGANLNAQLGLTSPGAIGADVCHINLHKTFCIPHGGGGPGMGPIAVAEHLAPYLPGHCVVPTGGRSAIGAVSAAPWGSPSILPISWAYIRMMGAAGLTRATEVAILNANYIAKRLSAHYPVLYTGPGGLVAHECILDLRPLKDASGVSVEDVAKRLMDYGFHAPTVSFPVAGTLMIEPTESESQDELDRFCDAMIAIRKEIREIEDGRADKHDNPLKNAPHTALRVTATRWEHPYSRERAAFPAAWTKDHKFWPPVARIDNAFGDRNLMCVCPPLEAYSS